MTDLLKEMTVGPGLSVRDAMKRMDSSAQKLLIVTGEESRLLGVLSDGDVRRFLLKGGDLTAPIKGVYNPNPITVALGYDPSAVRDLLVRSRIECAPVVDAQGRVAGAVRWTELFGDVKPVRGKAGIPVVVMAGGQGTRLHPFTRVLPKPLIPIHEKPILELIMDRFYESGCRQFVVSVNYKAGMIKAYFNDLQKSYSVEYVQEEKPLGTAGSLTLIKGRFDGPFFLTNCDILIEGDYADMLQFHRQKGNGLTVIASLKHFQIPYGVVEMSEGGALSSIREKPEYDHLVNTGLYIIEPELLDLIPEGQVYLMTDLMAEAMKRGIKTGVYPVSEKSWVDIGQWEELQSALDKFGVK
jgi:dTDP-glucose pyrophosphorylase